MVLRNGEEGEGEKSGMVRERETDGKGGGMGRNGVEKREYRGE